MTDAPATFFDTHDTIDPEVLPPPPITDEVMPMGIEGATPRGEQLRYGHLMANGTTISPEWDEDWIRLVIDADERRGMAICGAKRKSNELAEQIRGGYITEEQLQEDPLMLVCRNPAGLKTDHPREGRCHAHGGGSLAKTGRFSLIKHNQLSPRVHEFFEMEELLDLRRAIALIYAATDAMLGEDTEITPARAQEIGGLMSKVGALTKQHNEITEKKSIAIEVPEFMAWAEFFYELAIKYIIDGEGNVPGFLSEAQQFYNATVTLTIGDTDTQAQARRDSTRALGQSGDQ